MFSPNATSYKLNTGSAPTFMYCFLLIMLIIYLTLMIMFSCIMCVSNMLGGLCLLHIGNTLSSSLQKPPNYSLIDSTSDSANSISRYHNLHSVSNKVANLQ